MVDVNSPTVMSTHSTIHFYVSKHSYPSASKLARTLEA